MTTQADIALTAMCMWEETLELKNKRSAVAGLFEARGTCEVRDSILGLAEACHDDWEIAAAAGYEDAFDWEFVPDWMAANLDWSGQSLTRK